METHGEWKGFVQFLGEVVHVTFALEDYYQEVFLKVSLFFFPFLF